ncbi:hypothetical protein AJ87_49395 [Rhizobium yanglingense]|nr:hypothetical protein AJ87_49395 [Rhizobium yanglingense]
MYVYMIEEQARMFIEDRSFVRAVTGWKQAVMHPIHGPIGPYDWFVAVPFDWCAAFSPTITSAMLFRFRW